jgi:hypothetical protein
LGLGLGLKAIYDYLIGNIFSSFYHKMVSLLAGFFYKSKAAISLHYEMTQCVVNLTDAIYMSVEQHGASSMGMLFLDLLTPEAKYDVMKLFKDRRFNVVSDQKEKKTETLLLEAEKSATDAQKNAVSIENQSQAMSSKQIKDFATKLSQQICSTNPLLLTSTGALPRDADPNADPWMFAAGQTLRNIYEGFTLQSVLTTSVLAGVGYIAYRVHRIYTQKEEKRKDEAYKETVQRCRPKARTHEQFLSDLEDKVVLLSDELRIKVASGEITESRAYRIQGLIFKKTEQAKWENEVKEEQEYNKNNPQ